MIRNALLQRLGIDLPIIQAPMAGGPTTPELVAAVSNAGGLGSLGAAYLSPDQIAETARRIRALTDRPFNINLFAGGYHRDARADLQPTLSALAEAHRKLGLPPPTVPDVPADPFPEQLEAVLDVRPAVFSFTFGIPAPEALERVAARGIAIVGTATTVDEALHLARVGADAIVAQGEEAGGHRGTFAGSFESSLVPTFELVAQAMALVKVPVIASGGLMDGRDIARALAAGASAAQLGTAFLACPESGASDAIKRAILSAERDTTVITRAFSGRPARGILNAFIARFAGREDLIPPYPLQNLLTRPMRTTAAKRGEADYLSLWAGRGVARSRSMPAGDLVRVLAEELRESQAESRV